MVGNLPGGHLTVELQVGYQNHLDFLVIYSFHAESESLSLYILICASIHSIIVESDIFSDAHMPLQVIYLQSISSIRQCC